MAFVTLSIGLAVFADSMAAAKAFAVFGFLAYYSLAFAAMGFGLLGRRKYVVIGGLCAIALSIIVPVLVAVFRR